jgi:hypothetical protein
VPTPLAKLGHPFAGGLAAPARGDGAARGGFASVLGLASNPIRAGLSALIVVMLVYHHSLTIRTRVRGEENRRQRRLCSRASVPSAQSRRPNAETTHLRHQHAVPRSAN